MADYRMLTPAQLYKWAEDNRAIMRLRTDRDVLPGGYMAALAPMLASWNESRYLDRDGFLILRNVNYGGNSFERTTVLQSVRYAILVAVHRLLERGLRGDVRREKLPAPELDKTEPWMQDVARADLRGLFLHAPAAIDFLTRNPGLVPGDLPDELNAAGLLERRKGKPRMLRYGRDALRPYGSDGLNPTE